MEENLDNINNQTQTIPDSPIISVIIDGHTLRTPDKNMIIPFVDKPMEFEL